VSIKNQSDAAI